MLVLEDIHWIDPASLALLQVVLRELREHPLLVLSSHREEEGQHELHDFLSTLRREQLCRPLPLVGLSEEETSELLGRQAAGGPSPELAAAIRERTAGNPYFCNELWAHLVEEGWVREEAGQWRGAAAVTSLPEAITSILNRRLRRLSKQALSLLGAASVCGIDFDLSVAARVAGIDAANALDAVDEASDLRLVKADAHGRCSFTHALAGEALYAQLNPVRRARLHWRVGEELEQRAGEQGDASAVAHHFLSGASQGEPHKAIEWARRAAEQATAACGYEAAASQLERAVEVFQDLSPPRTDEARQVLCRLLLDTAEAQVRQGAGASGRRRFEEAAELARQIGSAEDLARAALGIVMRWTWADEKVVALLEEALAATPEDRVVVRARLVARLAAALYLTPNTRPRRERLCDQAIALARHSGDPALIGEVAADCLEALFHADSLDQQEQLADTLFAASALAGRKRLRLQAHAWRIVIAMQRGQLRDAAVELATFVGLAEELRLPEMLGLAHTFTAALDIACGRFESAADHVRAALRLGEGFSQWGAGLLANLQRLTIQRDLGEALEISGDEGPVRVPDLTEAAGEAFVRASRWQILFVMAEQGALDQVREAFRELMRDPDGLPPENARNTRVPILAVAADIAGRLGDRDAARRLRHFLEPYANQWIVAAFGATISASVQNPLGTVSACLGDYDRAEAHFERAVAQHDREGAVVAQARTLSNYVRMLLDRNRPGDLDRARALITRGLELATRYGLVPSAQRLRELEARRGAVAVATTAGD